MNKLALSLCLAGVMALPGLVQARPVTLTTQLKGYGGNGAKYYKNLRDWARGSGMRPSEFDGVSGASVGSGRALKVTVDLADALIDAGYEIRVDSAVEDGRDNPAEVRTPLTTAGAGKPATGRGYVQAFTYDM